MAGRVGRVCDHPQPHHRVEAPQLARALRDRAALLRRNGEIAAVLRLELGEVGELGWVGDTERQDVRRAPRLEPIESSLTDRLSL